MFLPTLREEIQTLGWDCLDVILITGDAYIDSPYSGAAVIGRVLLDAGYRVGIIAQPDIKSDKDITRLGEPGLFWGVTSGCVDSMVANFTPLNKRRKSDDFTPGGKNTKRPDRAVIVYSNLIRQYFKNTKPVVLGGIEASLRRVSHYDYQSDSIRKSILFDAKADYLIYGMGEKAVFELADKLKKNTEVKDTRGICYISVHKKESYVELPSHEEVKADKSKFAEMFRLFYENNEPDSAKGIMQKQDTRYLIQNPPAEYLTARELDKINCIDYERDAHPYYKKQGKITALDTIRFSLATHRGCFAECNFCSIAAHQGRKIISRSEDSILAEAQKIASLPDFKGYILDAGGPTANMYGMGCKKGKICSNKKCLSPSVCRNMDTNHKKQIDLLKKISRIHGVKKVFVASGIRYDLVLEDREFGIEYIEEIAANHVSGQIKIAPEHTSSEVLLLMNKPGAFYLKRFKEEFEKANRKAGKKQFLTYYLMAAHPGCGMDEMKELQKFIKSELHISPEQAQIFTPTPSTYSTLMYYTGIDPATGKKIFVEKTHAGKQKQKDMILDDHNKFEL